MNDATPSRRDALRSISGAVAGALGLGAFAASYTPAAAPPGRPPLIDTHVHIVDSRIPGGLETPLKLAPFDNKRQPKAALRFARLIRDHLRAAGVGQALCMPRCEVSDKDPLGIQHTLEIAALVSGPKLHPVGLAHPERFDRDHLARVEGVLEQGKVKALKAYLGYFHYGPQSPNYRPYYRLAAKYKIPVIFHTGDTYSRTAKLKYAHPLLVDEVAVDYPKTQFVLAHFGNPWIQDAAQVAYKNKNVWIDLSAILVGDAKAFAEMEREGVLRRAAKRIKQGIEYSEAPERFLFGSDWPLSSIPVYRDFVGRLFPKELHEAVFRDNARKLFAL